MSLVDRPALVDVLGETLVLVVGQALLVVDHVTDWPVHRGTLQYRSAQGKKSYKAEKKLIKRLNLDRKDAYLGVNNGVAICFVKDPAFLNKNIGVADLSRHMPTDLGKDEVALVPIGRLTNSLDDVVATVDFNSRANLVRQFVENLIAIL